MLNPFAQSWGKSAFTLGHLGVCPGEVEAVVFPFLLLQRHPAHALSFVLRSETPA